MIIAIVTADLSIMNELQELSFKSLFPDSVCTVAVSGTLDHCLSLTPPEADSLDMTWSALRRAQFLLGRHAAHSALNTCGGPKSKIGRISCGAPDWPKDAQGQWLGSISHTVLESPAQPPTIVAAAAVGRPGSALSIGLDIESRTRKLNPATSRKIATESERSWIVPASDDLLILACAKEALYKAHSPLNGSIYIGFQDAELIFDRELGVLSGTLKTARNPGVPVSIRIVLSDKILLAGTVVNAG